MRRFEYVLPANADEARAALAKGGVAKAGGIDLLDRMKEGISSPDRVISLGFADCEIAFDDLGARVGAGVTLADLAGHPEIGRRYPALAKAAEEAATPQVRIVATAAGNVLQEPRCWYYRVAEFDCLRKGGEGCPAMEGENEFHSILGYDACPAVHASNLAPPLVALGARAEVHGLEEPVPLEQLWASGSPERWHDLAPDAVITRFRIPPAGPNAYVEVRHKQSFDWALAAAAVARSADGAWRVCLGGVAPKPWRPAAAEEVLGADDLTAERIAKAADAAVEGAKPLAKNGYKVKLARVALARALTEAAR